MCPPVAVPAQPRIPAGRRFLQRSSDRVPRQGPATGWRAFSSKPVKWTIGRFYWLTRRTRSFLQLWRHGSDFIYTKNSAMGRSDCIYTKNSARPRSDPDRKIYGPDRKIYSPDRKIYSPDRKICGPEQLGAMRQKMAIFKEGNSVCRVHFFQELSFYVQKELMNDFSR